jgi:hypothetical protein
MSQRVTTHRLGNAGPPGRLFDGPLQHQFVHMVPPHHTTAWITRALARREDLLPGPFPIGIGVFFLQRKRQIHLPTTFLEVLIMKLFDDL